MAGIQRLVAQGPVGNDGAILLSCGEVVPLVPGEPIQESVTGSGGFIVVHKIGLIRNRGSGKVSDNLANHLTGVQINTWNCLKIAKLTNQRMCFFVVQHTRF